MNIKKIVAACTAATVGVLTSVVLIASPAAAHTPEVTASCAKGVVVKGTSYDASKANRWGITINGTEETGTFGASVNKSKALPGDGATSTWSAFVEAEDGSYRKADSGTLTCGVPTITVPIVEAYPPTCTEDGYLSVFGKSTGPAQNANGYEFLGEGFRGYVAPQLAGPGVKTITFQKVGAGFDPAFPNGTKVTGQTTQVVEVKGKLGQTTDPASPCFEGPTKPDDIVEVVVVEDAPNCESDNVASTTTTTTTGSSYDPETKLWTRTAPVAVDVVTYRELTDAEAKACATVPAPIVSVIVTHAVSCETELYTETTTAYAADAVWNPETRAYDSYGTPYVTGSTDAVRPATDAELDDAECALPELPETKVVEDEWVAGDYKCGDTTVHETRNVTTATYAYEGRDVVETVAVTVEERDRALTEEEIEALDCVVIIDTPGGGSLAITGGTLSQAALLTAALALLAGLAFIVFAPKKNREGEVVA